MPTEERIAKSAERCAVHPGTPSVTRCDACGRALCIECATPVRGRVLGPECLPDEVGPMPEPAGTADTARPPGSRLAGAGFAMALASTALPWTRFGQGSGPFGAWVSGWSMLAAWAALVGCAIWLAGRVRPSARNARRGLVLGSFAAMVLASTALAILHPPPFTGAGPGPWIALVAAVVALVGSIRIART